MPNPPIFAFYFNWVLEGHSRSLIFTIARRKVAVSGALKFHRIATEGALSSYPVDDRVQFEKPLLVALRPSVVYFIDFIDIKKMVCDHSYNLDAVIVACKTMEAVDWSAVLRFPAAQRLF